MRKDLCIMAIYEKSTIFSGVDDIFKYPCHQLIINEASNSSWDPTGNICHSDNYLLFEYPPLFLALEFWEPPDRPQPGFFLEARERMVETIKLVFKGAFICNLRL